MTPEEYERAVLERFRIAWPEPTFEVRHNVRLRGRKTRRKRQVDVAIYKAGESTPFLLIEAKNHKRSVDVGTAGTTIAMVQDLGGIATIMVATSGFSVAAANHLATEAIGHLTITVAQAEGLRWIPALEERFAVDGEFKQVSGELVEALRTGNPAPFFEEAIAYEEWRAVLETGLSLFPEAATEILQAIASDHQNDGHRYNAVQILLEAQMCNRVFMQRLATAESDPDTLELLMEYLSESR